GSVHGFTGRAWNKTRSLGKWRSEHASFLMQQGMKMNMRSETEERTEEQKQQRGL
ncbi:unnamed protein product, partial [Musa acuminata subsp. burmannicoides]